MIAERTVRSEIDEPVEAAPKIVSRGDAVDGGHLCMGCGAVATRKIVLRLYRGLWSLFVCDECERRHRDGLEALK